MAAALLLCLMALLAPAGELPRSPAPAKEFDKFSKDVGAYFKALEEDDRKAAFESLEKLRDAADKLAKRSKVDDLLRFPGDWEQILERGKAEARELKSAAGKGFVRHVYEWDGTRVVCMVSVPASYGKGEALSPAILALKPLLGMSGEMLEKEVAALATRAYGSLLESTLVVVPLGPERTVERRTESSEVEGSWLTDEGVKCMFYGLRVLIERVRYDRSRLVIDGWKDAGLDAVRVACSFPSWFAGVINRSGEVGDEQVLYVNLGGCPLLYVDGGSDARGADLAALRASCDGRTELEVLEDEASALALGEAGQASLAAWVGSRQRDLAPARLTYHLGDLRFQAVAWLTAGQINRRVTAKPGDADFPSMSAEIERESNTIRIRTVNVTELHVYLNDALVDLSKPVTIEVNGKPALKRAFNRDLNFLLENRFFNNSGDGGVYVAKAVIEDIDPNLPKAGAAGSGSAK